MTIHRMCIVTGVVVVLANAKMASAQTSQHQDDNGPLTLVQAIEQALSVDPRTMAAHAREVAATATVRATSAALWPSVVAQGTATRFQEPMIVAPLHRFDPTAPPRFSSTLFQSRWTAAYTLFDGGARGATIRTAEANNETASATSTAVQMAVIQEVATAFLAIVATRELQTAERARLASLEQERARVQQLFDVGRTARVTLLRADAAIASARASTIGTEQRLETSLQELARLLALPRDSVNNLALIPVATTSADSLDTETLVARANQANPQINVARNDVALQRATERAAKASWLPTVQLAAGVVTYAGSGVGLTGEWQGGVSVSYPIFAGGARVHRVASAVAAREAAESAVRASELDVAIAIERSAARIRESHARVDALAAAVTYADEVVRIERLALSAGSGVQSDFLRAEADLFIARADLVRAEQEEVTSLIALAAMTGDLSIGWLQNNVENRP